MTDINVEENLKKALHKRAKEKKEAQERHEKAAASSQPKQSRLEQRREANKRAAEEAERRGDDGSDKESSDKKEGEGKNGSSLIKIICLAVLVPVVVCIPFVLAKICAFLEQMPKFVLPAIWCVYVAIAIGIIFVKRHKATWDSVLTHQCIYVIFSLGAFYFMHVADNVPVKYRRDSLYVWNTITMLFNLVMMVVDDTDYQQQEREEKEKERKKEERRKRREERERKEKEKEGEQKSKKKWYNKNKYVKIAMDILVYVAFGVLIYFIARWLMNYKQEFDTRVREGRAPNEEKTWGYESNTGYDWKPEVHEEDLQNAEVGGQAKDADEEWHPTIKDEDLE